MKTNLNAIGLSKVRMNPVSVNNVGTIVTRVDLGWVSYLVTEGRYLLADGSRYMVKS